MNYKQFFKENFNPTDDGTVTDTQNVDPQELVMGMQVEKEHTDDVSVVRKIVMDHLSEDPNYYTKLKSAGLAYELGTGKAPQRDLPTHLVKKETVPITVFPVVKTDPADGPNMKGSVGATNEVPTNTTNVPAKDPTQSDHVTGTISSTPKNSKLFAPQTPASSMNPLAIGFSTMAAMDAITPQSIEIDVMESKKLLNKMMKETTKGSGTAFGVKKEGHGGNPDTDPAFKQGNRWVVNSYNKPTPKMKEGQNGTV